MCGKKNEIQKEKGRKKKESIQPKLKQRAGVAMAMAIRSFENSDASRRFVPLIRLFIYFTFPVLHIYKAKLSYILFFFTLYCPEAIVLGARASER